MNLHFSTGAVVGKKSDTHRAQVIKTSYGFGVVEIRDEEGKAQEKGMRLIKSITEQFELSDQTIASVFSSIDTLWDATCRTILLCVPQGESVTVLLRGEGVVYLKRDGQLAKLRSSEGTISGKIYPTDMIVLASRTFQDLVQEEDLLHIFDHLTAEEVAEKLAFHLHEHDHEHDGYAGLCIEAIGSHEHIHENQAVAVPYMQKNVFASFKKKTGVMRTHVTGIRQKIRPIMQKLRSLDVRITVLLLVLFIISIVVGVRNEFVSKKDQEASVTIKEIQRLYDEGIALLDLNALKSRDRLLEAKSLITTAQKTVSTKTKEGRQLEELNRQITEVLPRATQDYEVTPELFFDVALLKSGAKITQWALSDDQMALFDQATKTIFSLNVSSKSGKVIGGGSGFDSANLIALHGDTVYALMADGISTIDMKTSLAKQLIIKKAPEWGTIRGFVSFGGNLYLQDVDKSRIWKYVATETKDASASAKIKGFSELREYLNPDTLPNLSQTLNMAIDGSVWLGSTQGQVVRFTQGKENTFYPKGVEPSLGVTLYVYTDDNCTFVYVYDKDNKRIVLFEKDGTYKAQYHLNTDMTISGLVASEKNSKVLFIADGKLYSFLLK